MADLQKIAFKGFKQVTKNQFDTYQGDKASYMWFVRNPLESGEQVEIYFGNQKYAHSDETLMGALKDSVLNDTIASVQVSNGNIEFLSLQDEVLSTIKTSDFVQVLDDVEVGFNEANEKIIKFTWVTKAGESAKTDSILVSDLVPAQIPTDMTVIDKDITIEGGPLADEVKDTFNGTISAGTTVQAVLEALLCKEIYPQNIQRDDTSQFTATINTPSISGSTSNNALVEVGTQVTYNPVTAGTVTTSPVSPYVKNMDNGYRTSLTGEINPATSLNATWSFAPDSQDSYTLTPSITGSYAGTLPSSAASQTASTCVVSSCTLTVGYGSNTYKVEETAPDYIGNHNGITKLYYVSNLNNSVDQTGKVSETITAQTGITVTPSAVTRSHTVKGEYPIFAIALATASTDPTTAGNPSNFPNTVESGSTNEIKKLIEVKTSGTDKFALYFNDQEAQGDKWVIYLHPNHKVESVMGYNGATGKYDAASTFTKKMNEGVPVTKTKQVQGKDVTYHIWEATGKNGTTPCLIQIIKA